MLETAAAETATAWLEAFELALLADDIKTAWSRNGADFPSLTPQQFGSFVSSEIKRWAAVVKASGAKLD